MTIWPTVMVTGHRPQHLHPTVRPWVRSELDRLVLKLRDDHGMTTALSGLALGPDQWWADSAIRAGVALHAHVPFPQQADKWRAEDRAEWSRLLGLAARTETYGATYDVRHLFARNEGMVDNSVQSVGVWIEGRRGGTCKALRYAVRRGHRPIWVDPRSQLTWWPSVETWRRLLPPPMAVRKAA